MATATRTLLAALVIAGAVFCATSSVKGMPQQKSITIVHEETDKWGGIVALGTLLGGVGVCCTLLWRMKR